jgi:hypothetical protein
MDVGLIFIRIGMWESGRRGLSEHAMVNPGYGVFTPWPWKRPMGSYGLLDAAASNNPLRGGAGKTATAAAWEAG